MDYYKRKKDLVWNKVDDEIVVINPENGYVHLLNQTGMQIFEFLECKQSVDDVYTNLLSTFDCSEKNDVIKQDIIEFIQELLEAELVIKEVT